MTLETDRLIFSRMRASIGNGVFEVTTKVIGHFESDIHAFATLAPICDKERASPGHSYQRGFSTDTDGDHAGLDDVGAGEAPPDASVEPSRVSRRELRGGRARK